MVSGIGLFQKTNWNLSFIIFAEFFDAMIDWHSFCIFGVV